jgi:hypothetical protein
MTNQTRVGAILKSFQENDSVNEVPDNIVEGKNDTRKRIKLPKALKDLISNLGTHKMVHLVDSTGVNGDNPFQYVQVFMSDFSMYRGNLLDVTKMMQDSSFKALMLDDGSFYKKGLIAISFKPDILD